MASKKAQEIILEEEEDMELLTNHDSPVTAKFTLFWKKEDATGSLSLYGPTSNVKSDLEDWHTYLNENGYELSSTGGYSKSNGSSNSGSKSSTSSGGNFVCDDCGTEIKGFKNNQGQFVKAETLVNASKRDRGGAYCYNCAKRHPKKEG